MLSCVTLQAKALFEALVEARQKLKDEAIAGDCKDTEVAL